ncbi:MAG: PilZ domain-containing protein [Candidatus Omnitrophica bacterium]|nr:PilZ domain-containing protein [Candidatus Omnitrophota bacterium]
MTWYLKVSRAFFRLFKRFWLSSNRRRFKRVRVPFLLRYTVLGSRETGITNLHDLSAGGVLFTASEAIPKDSHVTLEIAIPAQEAPIVAPAKVIRVTKVLRRDLYRIATEFEKLKTSDRKEIRRLVERLARRKPVSNLKIKRGTETGILYV